MDNPKKLVTLGTQDKRQKTKANKTKNTTQNTEKMNNTDPTNIIILIYFCHDHLHTTLKRKTQQLLEAWSSRGLYFIRCTIN
jgi:hypothetical protein